MKMVPAQRGGFGFVKATVQVHDGSLPLDRGVKFVDADMLGSSSSSVCAPSA